MQLSKSATYLLTIAVCYTIGGIYIGYDVWVKQHKPYDFCQSIEKVQSSGLTFARSLEVRGMQGSAKKVREDLSDLKDQCKTDH